jgi:hypothetical protein
MSIRRALGSLFSPRRAADGRPPAAGPCTDCAPARHVRTFSLNPPAAIADDDRLWPTPGTLFTPVDGHLVVYDAIRSQSHVLNSSAAIVWAQVDDGRRVDEIIEGVIAYAGAPRAVVEPDVRRVLGNLLDIGIATDEAPVLESRPPERQARWAPARRRALDGRPWPTVIGPLRAAGVDLVARTDVAELGPTLGSALGALPSSPDAATDAVVISVVDAGAGRRRRYRLYVDGELRSTCDEADRVAELLGSELNRVVIDGAIDRVPGRLLLHAGAVERGGVVVAIAGDSGRGKSTLTARLVQRGWSYLTDEVVVLDAASLDVVSFPEPLDLDVSARALLGLARPAGLPVAPTELGAVSTGGRLGLLVVLGDEGDHEDDDDVGSAVRALLELVGLTFRRSFDDPSALDALASLPGRVRTVHLARAPIDEMADRIEAVVGAADRGPG